MTSEVFPEIRLKLTRYTDCIGLKKVFREYTLNLQGFSVTHSVPYTAEYLSWHCVSAGH